MCLKCYIIKNMTNFADATIPVTPAYDNGDCPRQRLHIIVIYNLSSISAYK